VIDIDAGPGMSQHLYYEDSTLLKRLSFYPYIVIAVMLAFVAVVYFAMLSTKRAEQNRVWVGLSKETAHQLGTPISSLMAWMELLPEMGVDRDTVSEMNKDINRLSTIASRFSKIGSAPQMTPTEINNTVGSAAAYMSTRISSRIRLTTHLDTADSLQVDGLRDRFSSGMMENLIKNCRRHAMDGQGSIDVSTGRVRLHGLHRSWRIARQRHSPCKKFQDSASTPGFTTKSRGWGLGLTLARRIIEQYHRGAIFVKNSVPGRGTTFRIELPLMK